MVPIEKLGLYPYLADSISIRSNIKEPDNVVIFYPENCSFEKTYPVLNIKKQFVRKIFMYINKFPKVAITSDSLKGYKDLGLTPFRDTNAHNFGNFFIDCGKYFDSVDSYYGRGSYIRPQIDHSIKSFLSSIKTANIDKTKILLYTIDIGEDLHQNIYYRRIYPLMELFKQEKQFPFEYFVIAFVLNGTVKYGCLINPDKFLDFNRIKSIIFSLKSKKRDFIDQVKSVDIAHNAINNLEIQPNKDNNIVPVTKVESPVPGQYISPPSQEVIIKDKVDDEKDKIKTAINNYIKSSPLEKNDLFSKNLSKDDSYNLATRSILYSIHPNHKKVDALVNSIPADKQKETFEKVKSNLLHLVAKKPEPQNNSDDAIISKIDLPKILENKNPGHILNKRYEDYNNNFQEDLTKAFNVLSNRDYPLKIKSMKKEPVPVEKGNLNPSLYDMFTISLIDDKKKTHEVQVQIPRMLPDGTFLINGEKKFLMYQIILDPIFFIKEDQAKLETLYAPLAIHWKKTKRKSYFAAYLAGCKNLPLMVILSHYMGFDKACKLFNIEYKFSDNVPTDSSKYLELTDKKYIIFTCPTKEATELINSLFEVPYKFSSESIVKDPKAFENALISITKNRNSTFLINNVLTNIMEPVSVEVLKSKLLPFQLPQIILYICQELVKGRIDDRNDLNHQRIRSVEVFNHQIEKLILGAYTEYRSRRVAGDDDAVYKLDVRQAVSDIVNSKLVRPMENINPLEELSCLTRITPVGDGGIPDINSVNKQMRDIHSNYYGQIDAMDTPENGNVGVINQLTIDANITSARGSFVDKSDIINDKSGILGINSAMIPYTGSTDGCRVMFSGSQGRQSIPVQGAEPPAVQTGYESLFTSMLSDSYIKKSSGDGIVTKVTDTSITIRLNNSRIQVISLQPKVLSSGQGQDSLNYFKPTINVGDKVKENQIVATGKHIIDGTIAIGTNLLAAVMVWDGYSYDDGYIISDKIAKTKLVSSSFHVNDYKILLRKTDDVKFLIEEGVETKQGEPLLIRTSKEIESLVGLDIDEVSQGQIITKSPGGKILSIEIYPNIGIKNFPVLQDQFNKFKTKYEEVNGEFPKKFSAKLFNDNEEFPGVLVVFKIEKLMETELGDKITNNYGGKGCIARIEKEENMPLTPWGEHVEVIINPLAIINRMNPSTIKEMYTSLISRFMTEKVIKFGEKKNDKAIEFISKVLTKLDASEGKMYSTQATMALKKMNEKEYANYIHKLEKTKFIPIIIPPFQDPPLKNIKEAMDLVGAKSGYKLFLKKYNRETDKPISVGYIYYKKLEQQSSIKMSARSTGLVDSRTRQATAGKAAGGGQRVGEHDSWALLNHGATNTLKEFFGPLSDDSVTKDQIISDIIQTGSANYREPAASPTKNLFEIMLAGLMIESDART